jgi:membrane-associated phospholipid phosphatase
MIFLKKNFAWLAPLLLIILFAPFSADIDLNMERHFLEEDGFQSSAFADIMFDFGILPAWILTVFCLLVYVYSYFSKNWVRWRPFLLLPILTMIVGSGIFVHLILKDHWGRPRPKQVIEFGGGQDFRPFYKPNFFNQPEPSKSFPCGHCSLGFYFFCLSFVGIRLKNANIAWFGFALSLILGISLGYIRMQQGGHFFSDVLVGAAVMWWTVLFLDWLIFKKYAQKWIV